MGTSSQKEYKFIRRKSKRSWNLRWVNNSTTYISAKSSRTLRHSWVPALPKQPDQLNSLHLRCSRSSCTGEWKIMSLLVWAAMEIGTLISFGRISWRAQSSRTCRQLNIFWGLKTTMWQFSKAKFFYWVSRWNLLTFFSDLEFLMLFELMEWIFK